MKNWSTLLKTNDLNKANLLKLKLFDLGIECVIINKIDQNYPLIGIAELRVFENEIERAKELLLELNENE